MSGTEILAYFGLLGSDDEKKSSTTMDHQYWPEDVGSVLVAGNYRVHSEEVENCDDDFIVTHLKLEQVGPSIRGKYFSSSDVQTLRHNVSLVEWLVTLGLYYTKIGSIIDDSITLRSIIDDYHSRSIIDDSKSIIDNSKSIIDDSRGVNDDSRSVIDDSRGLNDDCRSVIDDSRSVIDESKSIIDDSRCIND